MIKFAANFAVKYKILSV